MSNDSFGVRKMGMPPMQGEKTLMNQRQLQGLEVWGLVESEKITLKAWNEVRPWE
jgi:hypothetical protein